MNQKTAQRLARAIQEAHPGEVVEVVPLNKHNFSVETQEHGTFTDPESFKPRLRALLQEEATTFTEPPAQITPEQVRR